jgi:hypothetical protein
MKLTNKADLPQAVFNLLSFSDYNKHGAEFDISATKLIDSPQVSQLWKEHWREVEEDASDRLWSVVGSAIHARLEEANANDPSVVMEKRFIQEINGKRVSAQIDVYDMTTKTLIDLKTTSAWKVVHQDFQKYEQQLNIQACLARMSGYEVERLQVCVICRDWSKAKSTESNYPNTPIQIIDLELWDHSDQIAFIDKRLRIHYDDGPKTCTDSDRWATEESFAVMKSGRKRAMRVLPTKDKALRYAAAQNLTASEFSIEHRPAVYTRCKSFCAVSRWCPQFNATT